MAIQRSTQRVKLEADLGEPFRALAQLLRSGAAVARGSNGRHSRSALQASDLEATLAALAPAPDMAADEVYLDEIAFAFARIVDAKSTFTRGHSARVADYADAIACGLGLEPGHRRWIRRAALLHDIGKLGVATAILDKPGKLSRAEMAAMREHAAFGEYVLSEIPVFADLAAVVGAHHERLDGKGYPRGIAGDEIALETRIISAADAFDAMTADRPYSPAVTRAVALARMTDEIGTCFDPGCVAALAAADVSGFLTTDGPAKPCGSAA
jgi:HD-GYP domain-containing protein (c-di-GMP phosphodiesterase class II)